jgi:hypothetical protein
MTGLNSRFKQLYDAGSFPLTSIGGTADDVTATLVPALDGDGLLDGMTFTIVWGAENTAGMTLAINGGSPVPVLGPNKLTMLPASVNSGLVSRLVYWGGEFVMTSPTLLMGTNGFARFSWIFTTSATWTKPLDLPGDTPIVVEAWGAGGGGASGGNQGAGGGGGFAQQVFQASAFGATVSVTIGAGGGIGIAGGNSTFGSFLTAYGGGEGTSTLGGGGGGTNQAASGQSGGFQGGGIGGSARDGLDASNLWGGGGGGAGAGRAGGRAVFGGGGGASDGGVAGTSNYGGNAGAVGVAGTAPAGGGGRGAAGARGEIRVWI